MSLCLLPEFSYDNGLFPPKDVLFHHTNLSALISNDCRILKCSDTVPLINSSSCDDPCPSFEPTPSSMS